VIQGDRPFHPLPVVGLHEVHHLNLEFTQWDTLDPYLLGQAGEFQFPLVSVLVGLFGFHGLSNLS